MFERIAAWWPGWYVVAPLFWIGMFLLGQWLVAVWQDRRETAKWRARKDWTK